MNAAGSLFALILALQVTPPPSPPAPDGTTGPQATPQASPQASPLSSPQASPSPTPTPQPPIGVVPANVAMQPGQTQILSVNHASGLIAASIDVPVATIAVDQATRTITLQATAQTGRATLTVRDASGASAMVAVRVAFAAAILPAQITLRVTGNPIDPAWLQTQVKRALLSGITVRPEIGQKGLQFAQYSLPDTLGPGASAAVPITVHVDGGTNFYTTDGTVTLMLQNAGLDPFSPPLLLYDDDPEKVTGNGVLFRAEIDAGAPARLYYYHQNTTAPRRILVVLTNTAQTPATVQIIDASAGPNIDVMSVGHAVSRDFLVRKPRNQGIVTDIGVNEPLIVDDFAAMHALDGVAGSIGLRVTAGGPVTVSVIAVPTAISSEDLVTALGAAKLPGDGHNRTGIFDIRTYAQSALAYTVGGEDASIDYGASTPPATGTIPNAHDYGEYGVIRTIGFDVTNPTGQPATLYLYERPLGGVVRSSFVINGQLVEVGCARVSNRYQVGPPLQIDAGTTATHVEVQTMTDGGSNYPLEFGITATPPQPATPPISAADGCFPKVPATPAPLQTETPQPAAQPTPQPEPTG